MTLKNAAWAAGAAVALFLAVSAYNEFRQIDPTRQRLSEQGSGAAPAPARPQAAPENTIVRDDTFATQRSIEPELARSSTPPPLPIPTAKPAPLPTFKETQQRGEKVAITGGPEGLHAAVRPAPSAVPPRRP